MNLVIEQYHYVPESIHYKSIVDVSEFMIGGNIGDILY